MFIDIASGGDLSQLVIIGKPMRYEIVETWEEIVKENSRLNGDFEYESYAQLVNTLGLLIAEHVIVRSMLIRLSFIIDYEMVKEVRLRGYKLNLTNTGMYAESLDAALRRVDNLVTRSTMTRKEIEREFGSKKSKTMSSFEELMADLSMSLGFTVPDTITLSRFNEYKKAIQRRHKLTAAAYGRD